MERVGVIPRYRETERPRALIANERTDRLALVATIVALGHELIARQIKREASAPSRPRSDTRIALVGIGASSDHALGLIERLVREAGLTAVHTDPRSVATRQRALGATGSAVGAGHLSARRSRARAEAR